MVLTLSVGPHEKWRHMNSRKCWLRRGTNRDPWLVIDIQFPPAYSILPKAEDQSGGYRTR